MSNLRYRQQGLSIIEIMIALTLGLIITIGIVHIFTANRASFDLSSASGRTQETGRTAMELLGRAVRNADYWGCMKGVPASSVHNILNVSSTDPVLGFERGLVVEQDPSGSADNITDGSDFITVSGVGGGGLINVSSVPAQTAANLQLATTTTAIQQGDILFVSDCQDADVFQVTNFQNGQVVVHNSGSIAGMTPGNKTQALQKVYAAGATVYRPYVEKYFINNGSLYMATGQMQGATVGSFGTPVQLVSGVIGMQVELGQDTHGTGSIDAWNPPKVEDNSTTSDEAFADDALALRISILTESPSDHVVKDHQKYCFPGWLDCKANPALLTTANDYRLYRVYTSTVAIRNRTGD